MTDLAGKNQRAILNFLRYIPAGRWSSKREILEGTHLSGTAFQASVRRLIDAGVVGVREDPYDGRKSLYRIRREIG